MSTYEDSIKNRFVVSDNLIPAHRKAGFHHEVVDGQHPSDGGPVAISWHIKRQDAVTVCHALNLLFYGYQSRG